MSTDYENNYAGIAIVEAARSMNKVIIPISISKAFKPASWLGLAIAGRLFYRIFDQNQA